LIMPLDPGHLRWTDFTTSIPPLFRRLAEELADSISASKAHAYLREALLAVAESPQRQRSLLEQHLQEQIGQVLRLPASEVDIYIPLTNMGMDSLTALEMRNKLEAALGLKLSATMLWNYPTVATLTPYLVERVNADYRSAEAPEAEPNGGAADADDLDLVLAEVEQLSEDEVDELVLTEGTELSDAELDALLAESADLPAEDEGTYLT